VGEPLGFLVPRLYGRAGSNHELRQTCLDVVVDSATQAFPAGGDDREWVDVRPSSRQRREQPRIGRCSGVNDAEAEVLGVDLPSSVRSTRLDPCLGSGWTVAIDAIDEMGVVHDLCALIEALQRVAPDGAPPGRGVPLAEHDKGFRYWLARFQGDSRVASEWERALAAPPWDGPPVWHHGDLDVRNWVICDGRISGVIDWGYMGVGDPACDLMVAWKLHSLSAYQAFRAATRAEDATWERARGWVLSQAVAILAYYTPQNNPTSSTRLSVGSPSSSQTKPANTGASTKRVIGWEHDLRVAAPRALSARCRCSGPGSRRGGWRSDGGRDRAPQQHPTPRRREARSAFQLPGGRVAQSPSVS
jgi:hypothetical protein